MCTKSKKPVMNILGKKPVMNIPGVLSGNMEMYGYSSRVWSVEVRSYQSWVWFFRYAVKLGLRLPVMLKGFCNAKSLHLHRAEKSKNSPLKSMAHMCC